jgi:hypothetical protein
MDEPCHQNRIQRAARWVLAGFLAVAAFFLITEHQAHVLGALPLLLLLACPLMHLFMHGRHRSHSHQPQTKDLIQVHRETQEAKP